MGLTPVFLGMGSNLGDREANLRYALNVLGDDLCLETVSSLYETEPCGYQSQPWFLNCVCQGNTGLSPRAVLDLVKDAENKVGRTPTFTNGPRLIDVDILVYGQQVVQEPGLQIPHPGLPDRAFVLVPFAEIAPECPHPVLGLTMSELLHKLQGNATDLSVFFEGVKLWAPPISLLGR